VERPFQPGHSLIPFPLFNQVGTDIVVRIAQLWIDPDGFFTLRDGALVVAEVGVSSSAKCVGDSGGEGFDGSGVEVDGLLELTGHLQFVSAAEILSGFVTRISFWHDRNP